MSLFLETLSILNGKIEHLDYHLERIRRTQKAYFESETAKEILNNVRIPLKWTSERSKCTLRYDSTLRSSYLMRYEAQKHYSFKLIHTNLLYDYKFADREAIYKLKNETEDEVIFVKNGCITDCSYANLAFYDGSDWLTPEIPLLAGTARQRLLDKGVVKSAKIAVENLSNYHQFKLINALLPWEESKVYSVADNLYF